MKKLRSGIWRTNGGSTLTLKVEGNQVSGTYSSIHGQPTKEEVFPIVGFVNEDLIGFVASWEKHQSITSWCGRYGLDGDKECIRTVWHLGRMYRDYEHTVLNDHWETFVNYTGTYYLEK